jgi:hypothetical protein
MLVTAARVLCMSECGEYGETDCDPNRINHDKHYRRDCHGPIWHRRRPSFLQATWPDGPILDRFFRRGEHQPTSNSIEVSLPSDGRLQVFAGQHVRIWSNQSFNTICFMCYLDLS